ncbi:Sortase family protein [Blastococcus aurantiacus]|uniref:Sortase family protein n=1 Tax=Blastococcus aurantiacus TaxID=1550231 RepID=A0A1G7LFP3_9ACTN|nr:class F sortase [Blastococcus aurantiacus]SDF48298.1 Sortase family protein [Blastococcus aurantiacus]
MRGLTGPSRRSVVGAGLVALAVTGGAVLAIGLQGSEPAAAAPPSAASSRSADPAPSATSTAPAPPAEDAQPALPTAGAALPTPSSDVHVVVPTLGLDLPVLPLTPRDGAINPPTLTAAYWIEPYGDPVGAADEADNTLYLAAHSTNTGRYGFDPLLDDDGDSTLGAGDVVEVSTPGGTVAYTVERTERYDKDELPDAAEVWAAVPGRLVLITCTQEDGGRSTENLVVVARS